MKTRGILILLSVLLLLGVEGCPEKDTGGGALGAYIGGTSGLDISFISEEPPLQVLDQSDPFYITLLVENMGEYTIPKGKIIATLSGINKDSFSMKDLNVKSLSEVFGKSKIGNEVVEGGLDELQFDPAEYKHDLSADFATQLRADVCYDYKTNSLIKLCLKKNPIQRKQEDICSVTNENVAVENSGAPLQIRDVKSRGGSDSVTFTFIVENKGSGEVYEDDSFSDKCIPKQDKKDRVNILVKSESGNLNVKCSVLDSKNSGVVRLVGGAKTISCNVKTSALQDTAFEEPFEIVLSYFYKEAIGRSLTVVNAAY